MGLNNKKKPWNIGPLESSGTAIRAAGEIAIGRGRLFFAAGTTHHRAQQQQTFQTVPDLSRTSRTATLAQTGGHPLERLFVPSLRRCYFFYFLFFFFRKGFILFLSKNSAHGNTAERNDNERSRRFSRPSSKVLVLVIFGTGPTKFTALLLGLMDFLSNRLFMALLSYSVFIEENVVYEVFFSTTFRRFCFFIDSHSVFCRFFFYERSRTSYLGNWTHFHFV